MELRNELHNELHNAAASAGALSLAASRRRLTQISSTTVSSLVVKLRRCALAGATCGGAAQARHAAQALRAAQARSAAQELALACKPHS